MKARITKAEFYRLGGFSNGDLFRTQAGNRWSYWRVLDNR